MGSKSVLNYGVLRILLAAVGLALGMASAAQAAISVKGQVLDINGRPVAQAQVTLDWGLGAFGATAVTVFTDAAGKFAFPEPFENVQLKDLPIQIRALGFEQLSTTSTVEGRGKNKTADLTVVLQHAANQIDVAPASAWLASIEDLEEKSLFVQQCVNCHQFPSGEVRDYANAIHDLHGDSEAARTQSWESSVKHMSFLFVQKFAKDKPHIKLDVEQAYSFMRNVWMGEKISNRYPGRMDYIDGYEFGSPLIVTTDTVIKEYEVPEPNSIREAVLWRDKLWVAEVGSNDMIEIDPETGEQTHFTVPSDQLFGPHTLNKGPDGSLWLTSLYNSSMANLSFDDKGKAQWRVWPIRDKSMPRGVGIHDITYDPRHEMLADKQGRIWYSNIASNAVGYFHPETGEVGNYLAPEVPGRTKSRPQLYGALMESNQRIVWYTQLGIGAFGSFNIETEEFEVLEVMPDPNAGPRRMTITEDDTLYVPMYGSGQLVEYDTKARKRIGTYDLPDRGAAPYAVTWDPVRKVVWIATSNADLIYSFDPDTQEFGILPLPRDRGFLRMLQVDPETGYLVTSYANVPATAHGRRMALIIDPGDGAYDKKRQLASAED